MWLALRTLARRPTGSVPAFALLVASATIVIAGLLLIEAALRAQPPDGGSVVDAMVIGEEPRSSVDIDDDLPAALAQAVRRMEEVLAPSFAVAERTTPVDASLAERLASMDGVADVVPVVRVPVSVADSGGHAVVGSLGPPTGRNWGAVGVDGGRLIDGNAPQEADEVVVDVALAAAAGVEVGDDVRIAATGPVGTYRLVGTVERSPSIDTPAISTVWFDEGHARDLRGAAAGYVDALALRFTPEADRDRVLAEIRSAADSHDVLTGRPLAELDHPAWAETRRWLPVIGVSFLGVAILLVAIVTASVLSVALQRRQRELVLLRTLGCTSRQARRLIGGEVVLVALAAGLVAAPLAHLAAHRLVRGLTSIGAVPTPIDVPVAPFSVLIGVAIVTLMARVGAAVAARRPTKGAPVVAAGETAGPPVPPGKVRTGLGVGLAGIGLAGIVVPPFAVGPLFAAAGVATASLVLIGAAALLAPGAVYLVANAGAQRCSTRSGGTWFLAFSSLRSRIAQAGAICTTVVVAGAFAAVGIGVQFQQSATAQGQMIDGLRSDHRIVGTGGPLPATVVEELQSHPSIDVATGVATRPVRHAFQEFGFGGGDAATEETVRALWVDPATVERALDLQVSGVDIGSLTSDQVVVGREHAVLAGLSIGDTALVTLSDGTRSELEVVAIHDRELAFGELVVSENLTGDHLARSLVDTVHVVMAEGASADEVAAAVGSLRDRYPGLQIRAQEDTLGDVRARFQPELWANVLLLSTLCALAYLAVLNTLVAGALDRAREFALLRVAGAHERQILRQTRLEAALMGGLTLVTSGAIAGMTLVSLQVSFTGSVVPQVPAGLLVAFLGLPLLALLVAMEVATRAALRGDPVRTIAAQR